MQIVPRTSQKSPLKNPLEGVSAMSHALRSSSTFALLLNFSLMLSSFPAPGWTQEQSELVKEFRADIDFVKTSISLGDLAAAQVQSGSSLYKWKDYSDFLDLSTDSIQAYACLSPATTSEELRRRQLYLTEHPSSLGWLDAGLLATSLGDHVLAATCFTEAQKDPEFANNPSLRVLLGRSILNQDRVTEATEQYSLAIAYAESNQDKALLFRMRHALADDLYDHARLSDAYRYIQPCVSSTYPLERAWALGQLAMYYWSIDDFERAISSYLDLENLLPTVQYNPLLDWERHRFEQTQKTFIRLSGFFNDDPSMKMIVEEEATEFDYTRRDYQASIQRLEPWVKNYPMDLYPTWNSDLKESALWVHSTYNVTLCFVGRNEEALNGFERIISTVPIEDNPERLVTVRFWRAYTLRHLGFLHEAKAAYEETFALDVVRVSDPNQAKDISQPRVSGAHAHSEIREGFVELLGENWTGQ